MGGETAVNGWYHVVVTACNSVLSSVFSCRAPFLKQHLLDLEVCKVRHEDLNSTCKVFLQCSNDLDKYINP